MSVIVKGSGGGSGGEDLTAVLTEQSALIQEIEESLVGKLAGANITPETVLAGYRGYKGKELVEGTYNPATADPELIPANIRQGVDIFGVVGTMSEGIVGIDYGTITLSSSQTVTISHNLKTTPRYAFLLPLYDVRNQSGLVYLASIDGYVLMHSTDGYEFQDNKYITKNANTVSFAAFNFKAGNYMWFAVA